jgi:hypothetical protein
MKHWAYAQTAAANQNQSEEMDHSLEAIVMAAVCLESFINSAHLQAGGQPFPSNDRTPTTKKWIDVTKAVAGGRTFDRISPIYKRIKMLFAERDYIMHYKAGFQIPIQTREGQVSEAVAKLTAENATKAVEAMRDAIHKFHVIVGIPKPDWAT